MQLPPETEAAVEDQPLQVPPSLGPAVADNDSTAAVRGSVKSEPTSAKEEDVRPTTAENSEIIDGETAEDGEEDAQSPLGRVAEEATAARREARLLARGRRPVRALHGVGERAGLAAAPRGGVAEGEHHIPIGLVSKEPCKILRQGNLLFVVVQRFPRLIRITHGGSRPCREGCPRRRSNADLKT